MLIALNMSGESSNLQLNGSGLDKASRFRVVLSNQRDGGQQVVKTRCSLLPLKLLY
jgi:hypothetical protein